MQKNIIILIIFLPFLTSCFEKDEMVPPHIPGDVVTAVIPMTMYYTNQVYYNLEETSISKISDRSIFDLNFECIDTSLVVRLNTANFCMAARTEYIEFEDVTDTVGLDWRFDGSTGTVDSLAIYNWFSIEGEDTTFSQNVWVINRGINPLGVQLGLIKVKFTEYRNGNFYFTYTDMNNTDVIDAFASKDEDYLYTQYSFGTNEAIQIEPATAEWDLIFTQYTTMLFTNEGDAYPYLVTGVLQQYDVVSTAMDTSLIFEDITISDTALLDFQSNYDKIGYDWKELVGDVNTGDVSYQVRLNYNYIIKNRNSRYYKLRFVNFYNPTTGEKGFPTFEYQEL